MGGQSAQRFERLIEIAANEFFKKVGDAATDAFLDMKDLQGILIGGPGATKDFFAGQGYLHHELQKKVIGTFDTGYTDEYGLKELVERGKEKLQDLDLMREKRLIARLLDEVRKPEGMLAAYGEDQVREALATGAVDILLLSDGLRKKRFPVTCPSCGYSGKITADKMPGSFQCPKCGQEAQVGEGIDIVDDFFDLAIKTGTTVELISGDSEEGEMLLKAFGGIAAILRFHFGG
jgi:peptide chain release factor subunit 1